MTEPVARQRWSRRTLRALAWISGGLAFASPFAGLTISPKPAIADPATSDADPPVIVVRRITKRVIVRPAPQQQPVQYVYVGGGSNGGAASGGNATVAAPAPATSTGGS